MLVLSRMSKDIPYDPPSWSTGTDNEIAEALRRHYDPKDPLNLYEIWSVGDERVVHLSAMSATGVSDSHVEQDIVLTILDKDKKDLVTPINGHEKCAFVVGQKECFATTENESTRENEYGIMYEDSYDIWPLCKRRTWCNEVYKNAFSPKMQSIFKQFKNYFTQYTDGYEVTEDYFAIPSLTEIVGSNAYSDENESMDTQFKHYQTTANRIKHCGLTYDNRGESNWRIWWHTRTITLSKSNVYVIQLDGTPRQVSTNSSYGIAPFGCI